MAMPNKEKEYADRVRRFLKAELRRADVRNKEPADRLTKHGLAETAWNRQQACSRNVFGYFSGGILGSSGD